MEIDSSFIILVVLVAGLVMVLMVWVSTRNRWRSRSSTPGRSSEAFGEKKAEPAQTPDWLSSKPPPDLGQEPDEFQASLVSEQVEDEVRLRLQAHPDLKEVDLDFGTALDGSLEIWVDGERYHSVEEIPDARIREAIAEAVDSFNR